MAVEMQEVATGCCGVEVCTNSLGWVHELLQEIGKMCHVKSWVQIHDAVF